jgi:hypothetical protein
MGTWQPDPGEVYLVRVWGGFATGAATAVSGKRWFRDAARNDIQKELSGWPAGPEFVVLPKWQRAVRIAGKIVLRLLWAVPLLVVAFLAGGIGVGDVPRNPGRVDERENEVEDFPVMWAAPGTLARTPPWQLDPSRCADNYRTHLVITDRRFLVVGFPDDDTSRDEVLWETQWENIASVERKTYTKMGVEAKVHFVDGSWCRLSPKDPADHWEIVRYLAHRGVMIAYQALTSGQRRTVADFVGRETGVVILWLCDGRVVIT